MKLILASNSKDRKKILDNLHIDYEVIPSNILLVKMYMIM